MVPPNFPKRAFTLFVFQLTCLFIVYSSTGAGPQIPGLVGGNTGGLPAPAANTLPQIRNIVQGVAGLEKPSANQLIVRQNQSKAILDWNSFNIGANAATHFDQQGNADWAALNRIFDQNPSLIFGRLTGDGKIYLINQNGTLFGPSAKINVHTLVASSLDMGQEEFLANLLKFQGDESAGNVINQGQLTSESGGAIFLIAPEVVNDGTITTPAGQSGLIAGTDVEIKTPDGENRLFPFVYVNTTGDRGTVINTANGRIEAEAGLAGLYGRVVNQEGLIRSVSAISNKGRIELHASEKVVTGAGSLTATPISDSDERVHQSFRVGGGQIHIAGLDQEINGKNVTSAASRIEHHGTIEAPSGTVELSASERVYLDTGSRIDVSGEWVEQKSGAGTIEVQLNSVELKNDFGQKGGILQGETVEVNPLVGSAIGDLTGALNFEFLTAREANTKGGEISISAPSGDIIVRQGAVIDFSGGGKIVESSFADSTKLVSGNQVYDISNAPQWLVYDLILNEQVQVNERFGMVESYSGLYFGGSAPVANRVSDYVEGDDAGSLTLKARGIVLDGNIIGNATRGIFQTDLKLPEILVGNYAVQLARGTRAPRGGQLTIGGFGEFIPGTGNNLSVDEVAIVAQTTPLPENFGPEDNFVDIDIENGVPLVQPLTASGGTPYASKFTESRYWNATTNAFTTRAQFDNPGDDTILLLEGFPLFRTSLSTAVLNAAGLSDLTITANTKVTIDKGAQITLAPGGFRINDAQEFRQGVPLEYVDSFPSVLNIAARAIEHAGSILIPSGSISLAITDTITSPFVPFPSPEKQIDNLELPHRIFLADGSRIDASGDIIYNNLVGEIDRLQSGNISGGAVALDDSSSGLAQGAVVVAGGARLSVSGGLEVGTSGEVTAGDAGSLFIKANTMLLQGVLEGYSLIGADGGSISLHADQMEVCQAQEVPAADDILMFDSMLPDTILGKLILADNRLDETGFAHIALTSAGDLIVSADTHLHPSTVKLMDPSSAGNPKISSQLNNLVLPADGAVDRGDGTISVPLYLIGDSSITLKASISRVEVGTSPEVLDAVRLYEGAIVEVAPGGAIALSGRNIDVDGMLRAPAGRISISAKGNFFPDLHELRLGDDARIFAGGTVIPGKTSLITEFPADAVVLDGGSVTLDAANNLVIEEGAEIDVAGSMPIQRFIQSANGTFATVRTAGAAGRVELIFGHALSQNGLLLGGSHLPNVKGGGLLVSNTAMLPDGQLTIGEDASARIDLADNESFFDLSLIEGFSDLAFRSLNPLAFAESTQDQDATFTMRVPGKISLDAPLFITASDAANSAPAPAIQLDAGWLVLANTDAKYDDIVSYDVTMQLQDEIAAGESSFAADAQWIDIIGSVAFSGFDDVQLNAAADMRLSDERYNSSIGGSNKIAWSGLLLAPADLSLTAARIYPTTLADFKITTASPAGRITIAQPTNAFIPAGPIYSAAGSLTFSANQIDHQGYVAAPSGRIRFTGLEAAPDGEATIVLGANSVTSTAGAIPVNFGVLSDIFWILEDKPKDPLLPGNILKVNIEEAPEKSISLQADNLVVKTGALIDASGGGEVFGFEFVPGIEGLVDPFRKEDRYVILPGVTIPGKQVTLSTSVNGLPAGTYSLLPEEFAFVAGAYVIEDLGETASVIGRQLSPEGYAVVTGSEAEFGGLVRSTIPSRFTVRSAEDVFSEGNFNVRSLTAGEGGWIELQGNTTILDGTVQGAALSGFEGGFFAVSGSRSAVVRAAESIPDAVDTFDDVVQFLEQEGQDLTGQANVRAAGVSDKGLREIAIGSLDDGNPTETITVESRAELLTPVITLAAKQSITLDSGSAILALGESGTANLRSPVITVGADDEYGPALVRASSVVNIATNVNPDPSTTPRLSIQGQIQAEKGQLNVTADSIMVVAADLVSDVISTENTAALVLSDNFEGFLGFNRVQLTAMSELNFTGNVELTVDENLKIVTPYISGGLADGETVAIQSRTINLQSNHTGQLSVNSSAGLNRSIRFSAEEISLGPGEMAFNGFNAVALAASSDMTLMGLGGLQTDASLDLTAARLTLTPFTSAKEDGSLLYQAADYTLVAGGVNIGQSDGTPGQTTVPGGSLKILADTIDLTGTIELFSGRIAMVASAGITLGETAQIRSRGGVLEKEFEGQQLLEFHRGGTISLLSQTGDIYIHPSAGLDVSNASTEDTLALVEASLRASLIESGLLDAGDISLVADNGTVYPFGELNGSAGIGSGGSFTLDTQTIVNVSDGGQSSAFSVLNAKLAGGGFNRRLDIRTREGSITIDPDAVVKSLYIKLTADTGGIDVRGTLDASGSADGGRIELFAGSPIGGNAESDTAIWLQSGSRLLAQSIGGEGGEVALSASDGFIQFDTGAAIDVSGASGGAVHFRAKRTDGVDSQVNMRLFGDILGAAEISAEGVLDVTDRLSANQISSSDINDALMPGSEFIISADAVAAAIAENPNFRFIPGFEIKSTGNFAVASTIDLTSVRYGWTYIDATNTPTASGTQAAGVLTVRASGNITLAGNLVDHPTAIEALNVESYNQFEENPSWDINLVAGADLSSADILRTMEASAQPGIYDLAVGNHLIYTENGRIQFAAGGDVRIGKIPTSLDTRFMINRNIGYNLATYAGDIRGSVKGNLVVQDGGAIQSAIGDIEIAVGGDLELGLADGSAIRTTGSGTVDFSSPEYSGFAGGGSIALTIGGDLTSGGRLEFWFDRGSSQNTRHLRYWDNIYLDIEGRQSWTADYGDEPNKSPSTPTAGVATMAGGDLRVLVGGDLDGQFGTFKEGDVTLIAGGNVSGHIQVADGAGFFDVLGNVNSENLQFDTSLALLHAQVSLAAQGNIELGTVYNPTFPATFNEYSDFLKPPSSNLTYSSGLNAPATQIKITSAAGEVSLSGLFKTDDTTSDYRILPPVVEIVAGGDIRLSSVADFVLAPSIVGNLKLTSTGGSITGLGRLGEDLSRPQLSLSDLDPAEVYFSQTADLVLIGLKTPGGLLTPDFNAIDFFVSPELESSHANIHKNDPEPVKMIAAKDIEELEIFSPKAVQIQAGRDINGLRFFGQHLNASDLSYIRARGDINLFSNVIQVSSTSDPRIESTGLIFTGPGSFIVQAGGSIDLGISKGIQAVGNSFNSRLEVPGGEDKKSALYVIAGLYQNLGDENIQQFPGDIEQFFDDLRENGTLYSELRAAGELEQAEEVALRTEREVIDPFFQKGTRGEGNIFMTSSQISTSGKASKELSPYDESQPERLTEYEESSDIFIIAGGDANVGLTAIPDPTTITQETDSGVFTSEGGAIGIFTFADLNVNESRVMTFRGGDVLAYSGFGNINAGRGSKTAINAGSPKVVTLFDDEGNIIGKTLKFEPPSVGSGIRTLTYDPDGFLGPQKAPLAGDGFLFAPGGIIDAGEAGISTRNLTLGATEVLNAQNIDVGGISVGVPQAATGPSLGALAGAGSVSETSKLAEESAAVKSAQDRMEEYTKALAESLVPKWIAVEVIGFDEKEAPNEMIE